MYSIFITWGLGIISTYQTVLTLIKADVIVGPGPGWQLCEKVIGCENLLYCATLIDNGFSENTQTPQGQYPTKHGDSISSKKWTRSSKTSKYLQIYVQMRRHKF